MKESKKDIFSGSERKFDSKQDKYSVLGGTRFMNERCLDT